MVKVSVDPLMVADGRIHLVEEQNEVDGETHEQSEEPQVVEVPSQDVLERDQRTN